MSRAIVLQDAVTRYQHAGHGLFSPTEWLTIKEVCSILDPLESHQRCHRRGQGGTLSQSIFMCHELGETSIHWTLCNPEKATAGSRSEWFISSLASDSRKVREVAFTELEERGLASADLDGEVVALYLDPRYSKFIKSICANGGNGGGVWCNGHVEELYRVAAKMSPDDCANSPQTALSDSGAAAGYQKTPTIFELRQMQREEAQAQATSGVSIHSSIRPNGLIVASSATKISEEVLIFNFGILLFEV